MKEKRFDKNHMTGGVDFMTGYRCQLCDGVISKGRCKVCGMPYRNDALLYHPNERRQDHYKHAAPKAKEIMKEYTIPDGAKNVSNGMKKTSNTMKNTFNSEVKAASNGSRTFSGGNKTAAESRTARTNAADKMGAMGNRNKKKGIGSFWWAIVLFYIIMGFLSRG